MEIHVQRNGQPQSYTVQAAELPDNPRFAEIISANVKSTREIPAFDFSGKNTRSRLQLERRLLLMERKLQSLQNQLRNKN